MNAEACAVCTGRPLLAPATETSPSSSLPGTSMGGPRMGKFFLLLLGLEGGEGGTAKDEAARFKLSDDLFFRPPPCASFSFLRMVIAIANPKYT